MFIIRKEDLKFLNAEFYNYLQNVFWNKYLKYKFQTTISNCSLLSNENYMVLIG
jgi:hypothetical protein